VNINAFFTQIADLPMVDGLPDSSRSGVGK